jgi:hypothetical protein
MAVLFISCPLSLVRLIRKIFPTTVPFRSLFPHSFLYFYFTFIIRTCVTHTASLNISLPDPVQRLEDDMKIVNLVHVLCSDMYYGFFMFFLVYDIFNLVGDCNFII